MNKVKRILSIILCLILALSFAACAVKDNSETATKAPPASQTEEATAKSPQTENSKGDANIKEGEDESGNLLITLYNADSDEYHALQGKIETINTGIDFDYGMNGFRFVSPKNGVKVRLEGIMWSSLVNDFETDTTVFEITTEKGKIYEFDCYLAETIPDFRLVAEYSEMQSVYYMAIDGESVKNVIEMTGEEFIPEEITEDSAFYQLCVARAASQVYYEGFAENDDPAVVWDTVAYAVTLNHTIMVGETYYDVIPATTWEIESYMDSMYPEYNGNYPGMPEECNIEGSMRQYSDYDVTPHLFERFSTNEFYGVEDNGDGTYSVKIRIDDYRFEGYEENGLAVIVKPDANNPFGYVITDIVDCELPKG